MAQDRISGARLITYLALDYPKDKVDIIVVSDGSTDGTNPAFSKRFRHPRD